MRKFLLSLLCSSATLLGNHAFGWECQEANDLNEPYFRLVKPIRPVPRNTKIYTFVNESYYTIQLFDEIGHVVPSTVRHIQGSLWELAPKELLAAHTLYRVFRIDRRNSMKDVLPTHEKALLEVTTGDFVDSEPPKPIHIRSRKFVRQPYRAMGSDHSLHFLNYLSIQMSPPEDQSDVLLFAIWMFAKNQPPLDPKSKPPNFYLTFHKNGYVEAGSEEDAEENELHIGPPLPDFLLCAKEDDPLEDKEIRFRKQPFYLFVAPVDMAGNMGMPVPIKIDPRNVVKGKYYYVQ